MDMKKRMGAVAVLAVVMFGTGVGAEQSAPLPAPKGSQPLVSETFTLKRGEVKELVVKDAVRSMLEDPEIVAVPAPAIDSSGKTVFRLTGSKVGRTTLTIWSKGGARRTYALIVQD